MPQPQPYASRACSGRRGSKRFRQTIPRAHGRCIGVRYAPTPRDAPDPLRSLLGRPRRLSSSRQSGRRTARDRPRDDGGSDTERDRTPRGASGQELLDDSSACRRRPGGHAPMTCGRQSRLKHQRQAHTRRRSSSPTASREPLSGAGRLPPRSPWACTAPERSSSAWTSRCSTRSTSTWPPCCCASALSRAPVVARRRPGVSEV